MSGYEVYLCYLAMKQHFTNPNFDFFACGGKTNAKEATYKKRNDFYFFETLARKLTKEEIQKYMLATFISAENPTKVWVGDIKRDGKARYLVHQKQMDSLSYQVSQDCDTVVDYLETVERSFNWLFKTEQSHGSHPALLK